MQFKLGNGKQISMWHNHWKNIEPLKGTYPMLYLLTIRAKIIVERFLSEADPKIQFGEDILLNTAFTILDFNQRS